MRSVAQLPDLRSRPWSGGLRGGISVALALHYPSCPAPRSIALAATYVVVLFSVIVQGGSVGWLIDRLSADRSVKEG